MIIRDCYRILGVPPNAPLAEVRQRYRSLARQHHPDHHPDDPEAGIRFRQLAEAYQTIQQARQRSRTACQNLRSPRFPEDDEFFQEFFGISGSSARLRQSAGADFRYDLQISFAAALRGTQAVIQVDRAFNCRRCQGTGLAPGGGYASCPACRGRGRSHYGPGLLRFGPRCPRCGGSGKVIAQACDHCHGQGATLGKREYRLRLPPGIPNGARLRLDGEGGQGFQNGPPGNLEVVIHVARMTSLPGLAMISIARCGFPAPKRPGAGSSWFPLWTATERWNSPKALRAAGFSASPEPEPPVWPAGCRAIR